VITPYPRSVRGAATPLLHHPDGRATPVGYGPSADPSAPDWISPGVRDVIMYAVLLRAQYGAIGVHRAGYVTVDGLPASLTIAMAASALDVRGHLDWYRDEHEHRVAVLTPSGGQLLTEWEREIGGAA
jgi:hypothetical protein